MKRADALADEAQRLAEAFDGFANERRGGNAMIEGADFDPEWDGRSAAIEAACKIAEKLADQIIEEADRLANPRRAG